MATLTAGVDATEALWTVSADILETTDYLQVDSEIVQVRAHFPGTTLRGNYEVIPPKIRVTRAAGGTTAASHSGGATLTPVIPPSASGGPGGAALTVTDGVSSIEATELVVPGALLEGETATITVLRGPDGVAGEGGEVDALAAGANDAGNVTVSGGAAIADKNGGVARIQGGSGDDGGADAAYIVLEGGQSDGSHGRMELVGAEVAFTTDAMGFFSTGAVARPQVPATPDVQDVVDALVALGLITQAP